MEGRGRGDPRTERESGGEGCSPERRSMSALPSAGGGYGALHLVVPDAGCNGSVVPSEFLAPNAAAAGASSGANKRKRRPAGTPGMEHS